MTRTWRLALPSVMVVVSSVAAPPAPSAALEPTAVVYLPLVQSPPPQSDVITDGPWSTLPPGAGPAIALDDESGSLTIATDPLDLVHVLDPHPGKPAFANSVRRFASLGGRLYLGYGDMWNNAGPVDVVAYDPRRGVLEREMLDLPEEQIGGWSEGARGRLYAAGQDSRESWSFGTFYVRDAGRWRKRRTVPGGVHVGEVVEAGGRLYASWSTDDAARFDRPFVLASDDLGTTWTFEAVDRTPILHEAIASVAAVRTSSGREDAYAVLYLTVAGRESVLWRLYRFDGDAWSRVTIPDPTGVNPFSPREVAAVDGRALVYGAFTNSLSGRVTPGAFVVDDTAVREVRALRGRAGWGHRCAASDGWLYCLVQDAPYDLPTSPYALHRTRDLETWQRLGTVSLPPGTRPLAVAWGAGRMYVGTMNAGWLGGDATRELWATAVEPISSALVDWDADVPDGARLQLQVRTAPSRAALADRPLVGPDGTSSSAFVRPGQPLGAGHDGHMALQIAVHTQPGTDGRRPFVRWVGLAGGARYAVDEGQGLLAAANVSSSAPAVVTSTVFALTSPLERGAVQVVADAPAGTGVGVQVRTGRSPGDMGARPFVGPDGTSATSFHAGPVAMAPGHDGDRLLQYRAVLTSTVPAVAPYLRQVAIVTRAASLQRLTVAPLGGWSAWTAGHARQVVVSAIAANGALAPVFASATLYAQDVATGEPRPIDPATVSLVDGRGTVDVSFERAGEVSICARMGGRSGCSVPVAVEAAPTDHLDVAMDVVASQPHLSPVVRAGAPFTVTVAAEDAFGNAAVDYDGTVTCRRWRSSPDGVVGAPHAFVPADRGRHALRGVTIDALGEWNVACADASRPTIAGSITLSVLAP